MVEGGGEVGGWIKSDENGKEMLSRVLEEREFVKLPAPLDRIPVRAGNVVEIVGPCQAAKTQILIQAAISCILPKEWKGVDYGGLERPVVYLDLDCRFDIQRLSTSLKHHILKLNAAAAAAADAHLHHQNNNDDLFLACMSRFIYVRCYNSLQFLATLKTLHYQLQKEGKVHGVGARFLMIDSISAFYWIDRASAPISIGSDKRKNFSLHTVVDTVVQEIKKLLKVQPMLLLATKTTILGDGITSDVKRKFRKSFSHDTADLLSSKGSQKHSYREYMPSTWQHLITHRILVQLLDEVPNNSNHQNQSIYASEFLLPPLTYLDRFQVNDACIYMVT